MITSDKILYPNQDLLDEIIKRILRIVQPCKVVLFGSAGRGHMTAESDLDILIIVKGPAHRRTISQAIYRSLHGILTPVDIIVATEQDVVEYGQSLGSILRPALQDGKVIYENVPSS